MSVTFTLQPSISLECHRCCACQRWFACERSTESRCGSCQKDANGLLQNEIEKLQRTITALRGTVTRQQKAKP